jgi:hypothetical protein
MRNSLSQEALSGADRSQEARDLVWDRLYGMKWVSDCGGDVAASPVEILDSDSMDTRPNRRR